MAQQPVPDTAAKKQRNKRKPRNWFSVYGGIFLQLEKAASTAIRDGIKIDRKKKWSQQNQVAERDITREKPAETNGDIY